MSRVLGHHVSLELLSLWLFEVLVCGALGYFLISAGIPENGLGYGVRLRAAGQAMGLAVTLGLLSFVAGLYSADFCLEVRNLAKGTVLTGILALVSLSVISSLTGGGFSGLADESRLEPIVVLAGWSFFVFSFRLAFNIAAQTNLFVRRVLVIGADLDGNGGCDAEAVRIIEALKSVRRGRFKVVSVLTAHEAGKLTPKFLRVQKVWSIIVTQGALTALAPMQIQAWRGCRLYSDAAFWESRLRRIDIDQAVASWPSRDVAAAPGRGETLLTRVVDILLSLVLLVLTAPVMAVTVVLIKLGSHGPVLYRQKRVGLHGDVFTLLKFRSMQIDAEARGPVWAAQRDPRVTCVGAFIRLTRIDELPQLWNILRGEMSFIGPRPERPHFVEQLATLVPRYRERCLVKPGLTGWAQVNYPYGASVEDSRAKLSYDLYYVKHRNVLLYVIILLATVRVILFQKGAR